jgi:hypothetical protein
MDTIMINWWAVIVAAIVSMIIGSLWYGPIFGKLWMRLTGMDNSHLSPEKQAEMRKKAGPMYALQFILSILTLYILAHYIAGWQPQPGAMGGIINALWIWLGFIMPTIAGASMWNSMKRKDAWTLFFVNAGYNLILYIVFGAILGGWQ